MNEVTDRITAYLAGGGLFNPELAKHDTVRDLLIDCRAALAAAPRQPAPSAAPEGFAVVPIDATDNMMAAFAKTAAAEIDWYGATEIERQEVRDGFGPAYRAMLAAAPAQPVAELSEVSAVESNTAGAAIAAGAVYAELPMQFACSGVFPVYSADQMRAFADGTHALRTKSEASREFLERMLSAMEGVIDVADRKTAEFDALRSCVVDLTLMLFKPEALRASHGQAPAGATEDAARLDWLEKCGTVAIERCKYLGSDDTVIEVTPYNGDSYEGDTLRAAIDAAIDAARKQGVA